MCTLVDSFLPCQAVECAMLIILMSAEQLTAFWEAVERDASLQQKLRHSIDGDIDTPREVSAVVEIAKEAGFSITTNDLLTADLHSLKVILELNDEHLHKATWRLLGP